ncbi:MAG TPA: ABC transporter permease [Candidatus Saccharimonadales bacterium]|nr:ABC transporter permease [Candidatus Saccharimonadales bacterium]
MSWLGRLFHKSRLETQLDRELQFHIEQQIASYITNGVSPDEARRRARLEFGGLERVKEEIRDTRWETRLDDLARDFRYALRNLRKDRKFSLVAVFTLALGIGASTVAFSAFYNFLFNAFAAKDANRLAVLLFASPESSRFSGESLSPLECTLADIAAVRAQNHVLEDIIGFGRSIVLVSNGHTAHQLYSAPVTSNAFDFYGVPPLLGRGLRKEDGVAGAPAVFVLSHKSWIADFNSDPNILGKNFFVNGEPRTLIGIMPPRFQAFGALVRVWLPITEASGTVGKEAVTSVGTVMMRLKPGISPETASADLDVILQGLAKAHSQDFPQHFRIRVQSAANFLFGAWGIGSAGGGETSHFGIKDMLYALLAAVSILLLIACSNVANLLLARATIREKEIAVRSALGATRGRLIRQLLVESLVLAGGACALGCVFALWGMKAVSEAIPHKGVSAGGEVVIGLNGFVLLFAIGVTVLTTLLCGLAPALHTARTDLQPQLVGSSKGTGGGYRHGRLRNALVVAEVALSIVLLVGAGLMMRSFFLLTHVELGFNPENVLLLAFGPPRNRSAQQDEDIQEKVVQRLKQLPGVAEVAVNNSLPGYNPGGRRQAAAAGATRYEEAGFDGCSESLLRTLELRVQRGRWLTQDDMNSARYVAVINQTMARTFFPDKDPVGLQIKVKAFDQHSRTPPDAYFQIVGVIQDAKNFGPQVAALPMAFVPYTIEGGGILLVKTKSDAASYMRAVQEQIWSIDREQIFWEFGPLQDTFNKLTYSAPRFGLAGFAPLAGIGLLLVLVGIFSVMAYNVSLQTREIGIRMALGAQQSSILRTVLQEGMYLVVAGVVIGLAVSVALTRFLASQIWGVSPTDTLTFAAVVSLVVLVALAACLFPARSASRVDPLVALRYE